MILRKTLLNVILVFCLVTITGVLIYRGMNYGVTTNFVLNVLDIVLLCSYLCYTNWSEKIGFSLALFTSVIFILVSIFLIPGQIFKVSLFMKLMVLVYMFYHTFLSRS
jgi:hypothetical protein